MIFRSGRQRKDGTGHRKNRWKRSHWRSCCNRPYSSCRILFSYQIKKKPSPKWRNDKLAKPKCDIHNTLMRGYFDEKLIICLSNSATHS